MNRKKLLIALFLLLILIVSTISIHAEKFDHKSEDIMKSHIIINSDFNKIIVDKNGNDSAYKSIQQAIDDAQIGSTIYVKEGRYSEIIHIYKKINLIGEDKEKTYITPISQENGYAIKISIAGITLSGFRINNAGSGLYNTGIKIIAPSTTIDNCYVFNTPVGIAVWSSENKFSNCKFWGCEDEGIAFLGSSNIDCNNNIVTNCIFYENCDGIELQYSSNNIIDYCEFYENTHAGIDFIGAANNNNTISHCNISNNEAFGIYLSNSYGTTIENSTLSENLIIATYSKNNTITKCNLDTIYLSDNSSLFFEDCKNLLESNIKVSSSTYEIQDDSKDVIKNHTLSIRNRLMEKIITYFNTIRLRLRSLFTSF